MYQVQASNRARRANDTQYMSHGVSWAGSEVLRALYEAKIGNSMVRTELDLSKQLYTHEYTQ